MNNWLGPFKTADDAIDALRRSVAEIIGADPDTWPDHKNAPLAISAVVGLREGTIKQLTKERDALHAELETLKAWKKEVEKQEPAATVIKEGDSRYWTSERLWTFPDGKYPLYTQAGAQAQPAPSVPDFSNTKDAARYRWLRENGLANEKRESRAVLPRGGKKASMAFRYWTAPEELDMTIDAMIAAALEPKPCP